MITQKEEQIRSDTQGARASLKVGFAGSHEISWHCLKVIAELCRDKGDKLVGVFNLLTQSGAKHSAFIEFSSLEAEYQFPHYQVKNLALPETLKLLYRLQLDLFFIIGWHRIVPQEVIDCARYCLGMHSSLLPKNRGSSPVNWALIRGEKQGGMSLFHITPGVDSGDLVDQKSFSITETDTCQDVHGKATIAAVELLRENWTNFQERNVPRIPQNESLATLNERRRPEDGQIEWNKSSKQLYDWVRALTRPYPGAFTRYRGKRLFIWSAGFMQQEIGDEPGTIVSVGDEIRIAAKHGLLEARSLQFEGEPECKANVFTNIYNVSVGERMH